MRAIVIFLLLIVLIPKSTYSQSCTWVKRTQNSNETYSNDIIIDQFGNSYLIGAFTKTVDIDPGPNNFILSSKGEWDIFVSKYDANGNFIWAISVGGKKDDSPNSISMDNKGNLYITGIFRDTVDFNPSIGINSLIASGYDGFLLKLDNNGNYISAFNLNGWDYAYSVKCDSLNNTYISGNIYGVVDFNTGPGVSNIGQIGKNSGFIVKYDSIGNLIFASAFTNGNSSGVADLFFDIDQNLNIYLAGNFSGTIDTDPSSGVYLQSSTYGAVYVCKLDSIGGLKWSGVVKGNDIIDVSSIGVKNNEIFFTGSFKGTADLNPGSGIFNSTTSTSANEIYIIKLQTTGVFSWAKKLNRNNNPFTNQSCQLKIDNNNNVYICGVFCGSVDFDPGPGVSLYNSIALIGDSEDGFILKLDKNGGFLNMKHIAGSQSIEVVRSLSIDKNFNLYATGYTWLPTFSTTATVDFNYPNNCNLTISDTVQAFIVKYGQFLDIPENNSHFNLKAFPNPTSGKVQIELGNNYPNINVEIINLLGQTIQNYSIINSQNFSIDILGSKGLYILKLSVNNKTYNYRIEKI